MEVQKAVPAFGNLSCNSLLAMKQQCLKIMIVEDDESIRRTFQQGLEAEGYLVESFANGQEALDYLKSSPHPCLILLDLMMPVMNGSEFMEAFAEMPVAIVPVPVYLCSATGTAKDAARIGCNGFIKKPVNLEALLMIVKDFCLISSEAA
jgi:CheY-like chemotaxis protein